MQTLLKLTTKTTTTFNIQKQIYVKTRPILKVKIFSNYFKIVNTYACDKKSLKFYCNLIPF